MESNLLFALDIGTRSVVGLVGEQTGGCIRLIASHRQEHHTRAMLDGQIHDVPEVAAVLNEVKSHLEECCGPLRKVSVAAAGRALCTIKSKAETTIQGQGLLTADDERGLELSAIQAAQHQLATSDAVADPTSYYCVGYSVVSFNLDGTNLKTLIGQRGRTAAVEINATFLPRQVIDSLQAAVENVGLEIATLTLEPIAAINILIPHTMRHLNLALVDVGAGTSDVAITSNGSVVGYGMAPVAGDEITEAISQKYLLDFNVAETVKRKLSHAKNKKILFTDVLGCEQKITAQEITAAISADVASLAQAIAGQIINLNGTQPQAVLLVGGGSLTPMLPAALAQALDILPSRVAVRHPDAVEGIENIPAELHTPDAVTPLGILKLSSGRTLNFINVTVNDTPLHLFNLNHLTIANALLAAGIDIRTLQGRPGLGITVTINGKTRFLAGSHGTPGRITLNGAPASFTDPISEGDAIAVTCGTDGKSPSPAVQELVEIPAPLTVVINGTHTPIAPLLRVNGKAAKADTKIADRAQIVCIVPSTLQEVLMAANIKTAPVHYNYTINGVERTYTVYPRYTVNGQEVAADIPIKTGYVIRIIPPTLPTVGTILGLSDASKECISVLFNGATCTVPTRTWRILLNGSTADTDAPAVNGASIEYSVTEPLSPMVSDVLLAGGFNPRSLPLNAKVDILLNGSRAEYIAPVKNGDAVDVIVNGNSRP